MASVKDIVKAEGGSVAEKLLINPSQIDVIPGYNPRLPGPDLDAHVDWLAGRIKLYGFDPNAPIEVSRNGARFDLRHGHCRFAAVQQVIQSGRPILVIPALLEPQGTNDVDRGYRVGNQNASKSLTALDYAVLIKPQRGFGQTDEQIIEGYGKDRAWLSRVMDLAAASPDVHQAIAQRKTSETEAVKAVRTHRADAGNVIAAAVKHAIGRGKTRATAPDYAAVAKPRIEPPSLASLVALAVNAWEDGADLNGTMATLRDHPLVVALRGQKRAA